MSTIFINKLLYVGNKWLDGCFIVIEHVPIIAFLPVVEQFCKELSKIPGDNPFFYKSEAKLDISVMLTPYFGDIDPT